MIGWFANCLLEQIFNLVHSSTQFKFSITCKCPWGKCPQCKILLLRETTFIVSTLALDYLQKLFNLMLWQLNKLKLVLNLTKTKFMGGLTLGRYQSPFLMFLQENVIKLEPRCKYFGILLNEQLFFRGHIENVVKKIKLRASLAYHQSLCF